MYLVSISRKSPLSLVEDSPESYTKDSAARWLLVLGSVLKIPPWICLNSDGILGW